MHHVERTEWINPPLSSNLDKIIRDNLIIATINLQDMKHVNLMTLSRSMNSLSFF